MEETLGEEEVTLNNIKKIRSHQTAVGRRELTTKK